MEKKVLTGNKGSYRNITILKSSLVNRQPYLLTRKT